MKKTFSFVATLIALTFMTAPAASAETMTFSAPVTAADPGAGRPKQVDLDHYSAYTWRIDNVDLKGKTVTGAKLTFNSIRNWDSNKNMLFIHLLDTAKNSGIRSYQDTTSDPKKGYVTDIDDDFSGTTDLSNNPLIASGTANTFLTSKEFNTTATNFVYTFTKDQLGVLSTYFLNGKDIAFGLDPDCHFWNNGITFDMTTMATAVPPAAVPEPTTMTLLGTGLAGLYYRRRRRQQKA